MKVLKRGVVAMIDVLGFKGIWQTESPEAILERLCILRDFLRGRCEKAAESWARSIGLHTRHPPKPSSLMLSDTIVLAIEVGFDDVMHADRTVLEGNMINVCGFVIAQMLKLNTKFDPALVYRGAISVGDFAIEDTFVIGPAVDEAASWMDRPDAAIIVLTPGQADGMQRAAPAAMPSYHGLFMDYDVPLKNDETRRMRVLNPLNECATLQDWHDFVDGTKRAFRRSDNAVVRIKQQNTDLFLDRAREAVSSIRRGAAR